MEIYKSLDNAALKEFENLLNNHHKSSGTLKEGKILKGKVTKINSKHLFLHLENSKSEPILEINELKQLGLEDKIKIGEEIECYVENVEDKEGNIQVSASRALKLKGWEMICEKYEKKEPILGKIQNKVKGGVVIEEVESKSLLFCPGSQLDLMPLKDISHLQKEPQKFLVIKIDKIRGNALCSRKEVLNSKKKESKEKILKKYNVGDKVIGRVKSWSSFGIFFEVNGEIDTLCHLAECSWARLNSADELFNVGDEQELIIIGKDETKQQLSTSIKRLTPDPFDQISNYQLNKPYKVKIMKIMDWGIFCELQPGLSCLLHASELSHVKRNPNPKKTYSVGEEILCCITSIDKEQKRISLSHKSTLKNPFEELENKIGTKFDGTITNKNDFSLLIKLSKDIEPEAFVHCNDLSYSSDSEEELKKYKIGDKITVQLVEVDKLKGKIRASKKVLEKDPFDFFKDKNLKTNDILTVQIISTDQKSLLVKPEGSDLKISIKKSNIAINVADQRTSRWNVGDRTDCAISELSFEKRKCSLSIKLMEEINNKMVMDKYGSEASGKNLPFTNLSDKLEKKSKKKE